MPVNRSLESVGVFVYFICQICGVECTALDVTDIMFSPSGGTLQRFPCQGLSLSPSLSSLLMSLTSLRSMKEAQHTDW